jgi:hypothetical protein
MNKVDFEKGVRDEIRKEICLSLEKKIKVNNTSEKLSKLFVPIKNYLDTFQEIIIKNCYDIKIKYNLEEIKDNTLRSATILLLSNKPLSVGIEFIVSCGVSDKSANYSFRFNENEGDTSSQSQFSKDYLNEELVIFINEEDKAINFLDEFFKKIVSNELHKPNIPNRQLSSLRYHLNLFEYLKSKDSNNLFNVSYFCGAIKFDINPKSEHQNFTIFIFPAYSGHPMKLAVSKSVFPVQNKNKPEIQLEGGLFTFKKFSNFNWNEYYELINERLEHTSDIIEQICNLYEIYYKKQERQFNVDGSKIGFEWELKLSDLYYKHRDDLYYPLKRASDFFLWHAEFLIEHYGDDFENKEIFYSQTFASNLIFNVNDYDDLIEDISNLKKEISPKKITNENYFKVRNMESTYKLFASYLSNNLGKNLEISVKILDNLSSLLASEVTEKNFENFGYKELEEFLSHHYE